MRPELTAETHPETAPENIIKGDCWRISVLTEGLLRLEYDPDGIFEDRATQSVWNRNFPGSTFRVIDEDDSLEIRSLPTVSPYRPSATTALITVSGITAKISKIWAGLPVLWMRRTALFHWSTVS